MEQFLSRIQSCDSACSPTKRLYCDLVWPFLLDSFFIVPLCICVIVVSVYWSTAVETDCILLSTYFLRCHIGFWSLSWEKQERIVDPPKKSVTERQGISAFRGEEGGDLFLLENVSNARICFHTLSEGGRISLLAFKYQTPCKSTQLEHSPNPEYHTCVVGPNPIKLRAKRHFCADRHRLAGCHLGK